MYQPMIPCPACRRHVRMAAACPFCSAALPAEARAVPSAGTRLARGAMFAFAVSATACGGSTETDAPTVTDSGAKSDTATTSDTTVDDTGGPLAMYGGPPMDSGTVDSNKADSSGDVTDTGAPASAYGLPPMDGG
jgi:hypothetical protein